ncbi:MAG TPA: DNA alkylation repair protein [Nevskiaceae bacterium]|nr:DNA alkylation repair protein [Nevskiaceae bacterium]
MTAQDVKKALAAQGSADDAVFLQRFFKTGEGQYGAGDVFIGVRMPVIRQICKQFAALPLPEVQKLLDSEVHEHRMAGLIILATGYKKASAPQQQAIYDLYLRNVKKGRVNNWDLVDVTTEFVIGEYLRNRPRDILFTLAKSDNIWQRRVAIMSSFAFVKTGDPSTTLQLAELLLQDKHDLIQKAVGWMLREIGKRVDRQLLLDFLEQHAHDMPRTALRYAIEHLPPAQKAHFMQARAARGSTR